MSFVGMLKHRCTVLEMVSTQVHGLSSIEYVPVATGVKCFLDLSYFRPGKDPQWTAEAGRPADRAGVLFLLSTAPVKSGNRVQITKGPPGIYQVQDRDEDVWTPHQFHHREYWVVETPVSIAGEIRG